MKKIKNPKIYSFAIELCLSSKLLEYSQLEDLERREVINDIYNFLDSWIVPVPLIGFDVKLKKRLKFSAEVAINNFNSNGGIYILQDALEEVLRLIIGDDAYEIINEGVDHFVDIYSKSSGSDSPELALAAKEMGGNIKYELRSRGLVNF